MSLRTRCMQFLYTWVTQGKLSNIRKNQVEELEAFVLSELSEVEIRRAADQMDVKRIVSQLPPANSEESSDA